MDGMLKKRRPGHQTQWAAQFAVASELCKQGYEVALTLGNHPRKDLMVSSPSGLSFGIDVKGLYKPNYWAISRKQERSDLLFYVLAFVPEGTPNRYFILTQAEVNAGIDEVIERARAGAAAKGKDGAWIDKFTAVSWKYATKFEDRWDRLPH